MPICKRRLLRIGNSWNAVEQNPSRTWGFRTGVYHALKEGAVPGGVLESFYSFAYRKGHRLNKAKEESFRENLGKDEAPFVSGGLHSPLMKSIPNALVPAAIFLAASIVGGYSSAACFVDDDLKSNLYTSKANLDGLKKQGITQRLRMDALHVDEVFL